MYKVLLENDQVRILDFRIKPGESEPQHSHPAVAVYSLSDGQAEMTAAGAKPEVIDGKTGQAFSGAATVHRYKNVGKTEIHAIIVEVNTAKAAPAKATKAPERR